MDWEEIINKIKPELEKTLSYLEQELSEVRTSRPSASMIDSLLVDCFGQKMPIKSLGSISVSEKREIIIQPWDASYLEPIERALFNSALELSPLVKEGVIIVSFPPLTEDLRAKMGRLAAEKGEKATQTVRHWRKEARRQIDDTFAAAEISEDDKYRARKKLDEVTSDYNEKIDKMIEDKKKEITL